MPTEKTPASLPELLVSLMPGGDDRRMWRDGMASVLEQVAATDDLSLLRAAKGADEFEVGFMEFVSSFPGVKVVPAPEGGFYGFMLGLVKLDRDLRGEVLRAYAAELRSSMIDGKIPVFEHPPLGEISLDDCLGWVSDGTEACELLLRESEVVKREDGIEIPGIGKSVFGGVEKGQVRVATENGPYRDARGLYRWQPCFSPFYDSVENAGKPTPLNNLHIYKR